MSRHYHEVSDYYRRSSKNLPLAVSTSERDTSRTFPMSHRVNHPSPPHDDLDRVNPQNRRRIAVACSRCRKRKIKCSGDPGDGTGCTNCKNANAEPGNCQFLRVNSGNLVCASPSAIEWPYSASGSVSSTSRLAQFEGSPSHYGSSSVTQPSPAFSGISTGSSNRLEQGVQYHLSSIDSSFEAFSFPQPQYLPQGQDTQPTANPYGNQEIPRPWAPTSGSGRWTSSGSFEQEITSRCNPQSYQYASPSSGPGQNIDGSLFGLSQLAHALPDRVLPNPLGGTGPHYSDNTLGASQGTLGDSTPFLAHSSNRTAISWPHERMTSGGCSASAAASTNSNTSANRANNKPSSVESQNPPFGYIPVSQSPSSDNTAIASDYTTQNSSNSMLGLENQLYPKSSHGSESSNDTLLRSNNSSNNLYTYSSSSTAKRGPQSSFPSGTLANGEPYTPHVRQTYLMSRQDSMDHHSRTSHQTPIASVGSLRR